MKKFKIVPLSKEYAAKIRETNKDDFVMMLLNTLQLEKGLAGFL